MIELEIAAFLAMYMLNAASLVLSDILKYKNSKGI